MDRFLIGKSSGNLSDRMIVKNLVGKRINFKESDRLVEIIMPGVVELLCLATILEI